MAETNRVRRFPPPWSVDDPDTKLGQDCFIVRDTNGQVLAYVYFEDELGRRGGLADRRLAHWLWKGFFNHADRIIGATAGLNVATGVEVSEHDTRIDLYRFDHGASSHPGRRRDRHYNAVATGAPGHTDRKARWFAIAAPLSFPRVTPATRPGASPSTSRSLPSDA